MSIGMIILLTVSLLILFGVLQRVLDRMALTDRQALICVASIFIGGWLPDIPFGNISVNIGGALIPVIICVYLLLHAGTVKEQIRALVSSALTCAAVTLISIFFPSDPTAMPFDPMILYGISAGLIAWLLGRSRRSAFISGVLGIILADVITAIQLYIQGIQQTISIGGAGALDAVILAGIVGVLMCELIGETAERAASGQSSRLRKDNAVHGGTAHEE